MDQDLDLRLTVAITAVKIYCGFFTNVIAVILFLLVKESGEQERNQKAKAKKIEVKGTEDRKRTIPFEEPQPGPSGMVNFNAVNIRLRCVNIDLLMGPSNKKQCTSPSQQSRTILPFARENSTYPGQGQRLMLRSNSRRSPVYREPIIGVSNALLYSKLKSLVLSKLHSLSEYTRRSLYFHQRQDSIAIQEQLGGHRTIYTFNSILRWLQSKYGNKSMVDYDLGIILMKVKRRQQSSKKLEIGNNNAQYYDWVMPDMRWHMIITMFSWMFKEVDPNFLRHPWIERLFFYLHKREVFASINPDDERAYNLKILSVMFDMIKNLVAHNKQIWSFKAYDSDSDDDL